LLVVFTQDWPLGQSEVTTQARFVDEEQFPQTNSLALSSTRPFPAALEAAPTHQSAKDESTLGL
jgi:hypothetical protein